MPLTEQENEIENTKWKDGTVLAIHTQQNGQWLMAEDEDSFVDLDETR